MKGSKEAARQENRWVESRKRASKSNPFTVGLRTGNEL